MAEKLALFENLLNCSICLETFKDPVSLSCNHSFCSTCLEEFWERNTSKNCPVCRRKSSKESPEVNFALKQLADSFDDRQKYGSSETVEEVKVELVCPKHQGAMQMFCEDEQKALCSVCEFSLHPGHKVVPVEEAVRGLKEQLESDLTALNEKKEQCGDVEEKYRQRMQHSKEQVLSTEKQIRAEFDKLRLFLKEEEEFRVAALNEEEEQKRKIVIREMEKVEEQMSSLSGSISAVEEELQKDIVAFLSSYKGIQSRARDQCSQSDPQLVPGALIDVAKHLGNLSFSVWQKMKDKVHFSPVILDPKTAGRNLQLSDDLTSVRFTETPQQLPDNPERHTMYPEVVGSEGFSSGQHSWEVEVGDHPEWIISVVKESADRKGENDLTPEYGFWCLTYLDVEYSSGSDETVTVKKSLERIRVQLDFDRGKISFYNAVDMTHVCTHRHTFTEKLLPYFFVHKREDETAGDIRICKRDFSVMFGQDGELQ